MNQNVTNNNNSFTATWVVFGTIILSKFNLKAIVYMCLSFSLNYIRDLFLCVCFFNKRNNFSIKVVEESINYDLAIYKKTSLPLIAHGGAS